MFKSLTDKIEFIKQYDEFAAQVYKDKKYYYLTTSEICEYTGKGNAFIKEKYDAAKELLKEPEQAWMFGLTNRTKMALMSHYGDFMTLYNDVMNDNVDLECLPKIGHKVAVEVRGWLISKSKAT